MMRLTPCVFFLLLLLFPGITKANFPVSPENANIKMLYAEGKIFYSEIYVSWATEFEKSNCEFFVERSTDGENWFIRGRIKSKGSANKFSEYKYVDERDDQYKYYRIRKLDPSGSSVLKEFELENYSIEVDLHHVQVAEEKRLVMQYTVDKDQELLVRIYNRIGEQVITKIMPFKWAGDFIFHLDVSELDPGNYLLEVNQTMLDKTVAEKQFTISD